MLDKQRQGPTSHLKPRRVICGAAVMLLGVAAIPVLVGCPSGGEPGANEVFMRAFAFDPAEITINAGETVTWTNMDIVIPHTATSGNPGDADLGSVFRSANLSQGDTFAHTFDEAGEFVYFCERHPVMMRDAKVIVVPNP